MYLLEIVIKTVKNKMRTIYKISIIAASLILGWILFPNVTEAVCYFGYAGGIVNDEEMYEPQFCSITGINLFGYSIDTNFFHERAITGFFEECYYKNDGKIKICGTS